MSRVKAAVARERELAVLACLQEHLDGAEGAVISIAGVARETGLSACQARSALQRLTRKRLVDVGSRSFPNGASAENLYRLTQAGFALLEDGDRAPGCEQQSSQR